MIKRYGFKTIPVARIKAPGDIGKRRAADHVIDLGKSFADTGGQPAEPIIVNKKTNELVAGGDRLAACLNEEVKRVDALLISGTSEELEKVTLIENIRRRHSGPELDAAIARLMELEHPKPAQTFPEIDTNGEEESSTSEETAPEVETTNEPRKVGRPKGSKTKARERVAKMTGKTVAAVRAAETRDANRKVPKKEKQDIRINTMGLEVPDDVVKKSTFEHTELESMLSDIIELIKWTRRLEKQSSLDLDTLRTQLENAVEDIKVRMPDSLCPWCKCTKKLRKECIACSGRGFLNAYEMTSVDDKKLLAEGDKAGVYIDGTFILVSAIG